MTAPTLETKYVFTITAKIGDVVTAGETGSAFAASSRLSAAR